MTATARFFATTELVEATLFSLQPRDILLSQRVSHKSRDVVAGSQKLQNRLFLPSTLSKPLKRIYKTMGASVLPIPEPLYVTNDEAETQMEIVENPLFVTRFDKDSVYDEEEKAARKQILFKTTDALLDQDASWRKMYRTSPPVPHVSYKATHVSASGMKKRDTGKREREVSRASGVRLGDLVGDILKLNIGGKGGAYYVNIVTRDLWKKRGGKGLLEDVLGRLSGPVQVMSFTGPPGGRATKHFGSF
ncbi:hypothetical protein LTR85_007847 [Meristemomyces frigidus]|nr:hypothetical protein LTR85_007847 [Meristemomyces frigidus]